MKFDKLTEAYLKIVNEDVHSSDIYSELGIDESRWGESYQEVKHLVDELLSYYHMDKSVLVGVLKYAEEVGHTGEGVNNLLKLIQHFNEIGVQNS